MPPWQTQRIPVSHPNYFHLAQILQDTEILTWCMWIKIRFLPLPCQSTVAVLWDCSYSFAHRLYPTSGIASAVCNWRDVADIPTSAEQFLPMFVVHIHFVLFVGSENPKATDVFEVSGGWQRTRKELAEEEDVCDSGAGDILHAVLLELSHKLLLILRQLVAVCGVTVQEAAHKGLLRDNIVKLFKCLRSHSHLNSLTVHCQEGKIWGLFSMLFWKMVNFLLIERLSNTDA